jgi:hypothetical protein
MYDYLTRRESVRLALCVAWWAFSFLCCVVCAFWAFVVIITSRFNISEAVQVARLLCLALSVVAACGAYYAINDSFRHWAWISFERSLRGRAGK